MNYTTHNAIVNFIWGIADDVLRDVYVLGKYRDVILPITVLRRLDCLLEPSKDEVLKLYQQLKAGDFGLNAIARELPIKSGYVFYNTSKFTFKTLKVPLSNVETRRGDHFVPLSDILEFAPLLFFGLCKLKNNPFISS